MDRGNGEKDRRPAAKTAGPSRRGIAKRLSDRLVRSNADLILIGVVLACYHASSVRADSAGNGKDDDHHSEQDDHHRQTESEMLTEEKREVYALLFPWFAQIVGVFAYYLISRYSHAVPYTALMFVIGATIGFFVEREKLNSVTFSTRTWLDIEGEVILLVFLPGLLYLDSYNIDVNLFFASFSQLLTFAFPMVLAGTTLTALIGYYIFPYGWSLDLCMTFGSILAATDPVAVAVLLNELGAPPRLKIHVSGESLLNDGSAVVFYHIFSLRFFHELGVHGVGHDIGWGEGFRLFFQLALGGACIGVAFALGLLVILFNLNRRLSGEDSVVQVVATITTAYLVFFTSEILAGCSGIIAVVFCGVTVKAFGETLYNDSHLSHHFWEILEWLLNTLLFTLGGCEWGNIIWVFDGLDWAYLFILFGLLIVMRFFLVFAFYPITSHIGIGSSWREAVFMSYGGLRGAVGIALALSLYAETTHYTSAVEVGEETREEFRDFTGKLFGMVGGIALLTLVINATTCGPLLRALGLITPTETRRKLVDNYRQHMIQYVLREFVALLTEKRFQDTDFPVVKHHFSFFRDVTYEQLMAAVKKHKDSSPESSYAKPNLKNVIPYLYQVTDVEDGNFSGDPSGRPCRPSEALRRNRATSVRHIQDQGRNNAKTIFDVSKRYDDHESRVQEERLVFIKILHSAYHHLIHAGELESRGFLVHALFKSLTYAENAAEANRPLSDWEALEVTSSSFARPAQLILGRLRHFGGLFNLKRCCKKKEFGGGFDSDFFVVSVRVRQILAFKKAHEWARRIFKEEFSEAGKDSLSAAEKAVLDESSQQVDMADEALEELGEEDVAMVKSLLLCHILLNRAAGYFKKLASQGLMSEREAGAFLEDIEENIRDVMRAHGVDRSEDMTRSDKERRLSQIPAELTQSLLGSERP